MGRDRKYGGKGKGKGGKGKKGGKGGKSNGKKGKDRQPGGGGGQPQDKKRRTGSGPIPTCAVVISCNSPSMCTKATREAVRMLYDSLIALRPGVATAVSAASRDADKAEDRPEQAPATTLVDELDAELQELRGVAGEPAGPQRPRIAFYSEPSRGMALIGCPAAGEEKEDAEPSPSPSQLVAHVFANHGERGGGRVARYVVRMIPLDHICSPHLKQFQTAASTAIPKAFAGAPKGASWNLQFQSRAMNTIKREDVLMVLKEILVPLDIDISCCDADYTVVVEINPTLCGFSVVRDYSGNLHECNLQALCAASGRVASESDDDEDDSEEMNEDQEQANGDGGEQAADGDAAVENRPGPEAEEATSASQRETTAFAETSVDKEVEDRNGDQKASQAEESDKTAAAA